MKFFVAQRPSGSYEVDLALLASGSAAAQQFIASGRGKVLVSQDTSNTPTPVGRVSISKVDVGAAAHAGVDPKSLFRSGHSTLSDDYKGVFDPSCNSGTFWPGVAQVLGITRCPRSVLTIDEVEIYKAHRGQQLGHAVVGAIMSQFGKAGDLVICMASPLGNADMNGQQLQQEAQRLAAYWSRMGFSPARLDRLVRLVP